MSRGCTRTRIPATFGRPESWPRPAILQLSEQDQEIYRRRERALRMYAERRDFPTIQSEVGLGRREVFRLLQRFTAPSPTGGIYGLFGLLPRLRIRVYQRRKPLRLTPGSSSGYAGAMGSLLEQHAEVEDILYRLLLGTDERALERRPTFRTVHAGWLEELRRLGLDETDWPFCCGDQGYCTLIRYCKQLIAQNADRGVKMRYGKAAADRLAKVGRGIPPLIQPLRPGTFAILDYGKADTASCFTFKTPEGKELAQVLPRWYIAVLVDEYTSGTWSAFNTMEVDPSADSVLEALDRAIRPETYSEKATQSGAAELPTHIHELLPSFGFSGVSVLKLDNARCNRAFEVVDRIIFTLGCVVNFGPYRTWVRRDVVEHVIGRLSATGAKRLRSSYGTGPMDPLRGDAAKEAISLHLDYREVERLLRNCCRAHNRNASERLHWSSPTEYISRALADPASGVFPNPLPQIAIKNSDLLDHIVECTVRGSLKKGERPYVRWGRCRYTNPVLASSWQLLGKSILLYIKRYDARLATAILPKTGESLGLLIPERAWREYAISLRMRQLINRAGLRLAAHEREDPLEVWQKEWAATRQTRTGARSRKRSSRDAIWFAREQRLREAHAGTGPHDSEAGDGYQEPNGVDVGELRGGSGLDPFGLDEVPDLTKRGRP